MASLFPHTITFLYFYYRLTLVHITLVETNGPEKAMQTHAKAWGDFHFIVLYSSFSALWSQGREVFNSSSYLHLSLILHRLPGNAVTEQLTFQLQPLFLLIGKCFVSTNQPGIFPIKTSSQSRYNTLHQGACVAQKSGDTKGFLFFHIRPGFRWSVPTNTCTKVYRNMCTHNTHVHTHSCYLWMYTCTHMCACARAHTHIPDIYMYI